MLKDRSLLSWFRVPNCGTHWQQFRLWTAHSARISRSYCLEFQMAALVGRPWHRSWVKLVNVQLRLTIYLHTYETLLDTLLTLASIAASTCKANDKKRTEISWSRKLLWRLDEKEWPPCYMDSLCRTFEMTGMSPMWKMQKESCFC
jgi:hypothetical protein